MINPNVALCCEVSGCDNKRNTDNLTCKKHTTCKVSQCSTVGVVARNLCRKHYEEYLSNGPDKQPRFSHYQKELDRLDKSYLLSLVQTTHGNLSAIARDIGCTGSQLETFKKRNVWFSQAIKEVKEEYFSPEKVAAREYQAKLNWQKNNPDKVREINRRWAKSQSPEKRARWNNYNRKRRYDSMSKDIMSAESEHYASIIKNDPCVWCGSTDTESSIDHIVPIVDGGSNQWENFAPACRSCNSAKNRKSVLEFLLADGLKTKK